MIRYKMPCTVQHVITAKIQQIFRNLNGELKYFDRWLPFYWIQSNFIMNLICIYSVTTENEKFHSLILIGLVRLARMSSDTTVGFPQTVRTQSVMTSRATVSPFGYSPITLKPRYDLSTYMGRLWKFIDLTSPRHLFRTDTAIRKCQATLKLAMQGEVVAHNEVDKCQSMIDACVHPTTKDIIPFWGRMASFVPVNIPICAGMLFAAPTLPNIIGWQWINQSYNAIFNHCNAAKPESEDTQKTQTSFLDKHGDILKGYTCAVIVSVGLSVGLTRWLKRTNFSPRIKSCLQTVVPYTAVASAAMANVGLMRINELSVGLPVATSEGVYVGHSKIAAKKALIETCISRAVLSVPILLLPPPLIALALRWNLLRSNRCLKAITELSFLTFGIAVGLPMAIALYPQDAKLGWGDIEPELKQKAMEIRKESAIANDSQYVVFNKGV